MSFLVHRFGTSVDLFAEDAGLLLQSEAPVDLSTRQAWPADAIQSQGGWRSATEIEQLLELGIAKSTDAGIIIPYENFVAAQTDLRVSMISAWTAPSPFMLRIDRRSDLGRPDFQYKYEFLLGSRVVDLNRVGYYARRTGSEEIYLLDL